MTLSSSAQIRCMRMCSERSRARRQSAMAAVRARAGLCSSTVVTMHADKSALEALAVMKQHDISGIAIVDDGGAFLGNFSMSELRSIRVEHLGALALPVAEFLAVTRGTDGSAGAARGVCELCIASSCAQGDLALARGARVHMELVPAKESPVHMACVAHDSQPTTLCTARVLSVRWRLPRLP